MDWYDELSQLHEATVDAEQAELQADQELLKTYISKLDPEMVAKYEEIVGASILTSISIRRAVRAYKDNREQGVPLYWITIKGLADDRNQIDGDLLRDEQVALKYLTKKLKEVIAAKFARATDKEFRQIDIFKQIESRDASAIIRSASGMLYTVKRNYQGRLCVYDLEDKPSYVGEIDFPYEVIYTHVYKADDNRFTYRDSHAARYYSWNSKYESDLGDRIPEEGRKDGYIGSYTNVTKVDNPTSEEYSHMAGIDSWARKDIVEGATD